MIYFSGSMSQNSRVQISSSDNQKAKIGEVRLLEWSTEPPKEEGWYWVFLVGEAVIVKVLKDWNGQLLVYHPGNELSYPPSDYSHWLGPLPAPEPPAGSEKP